MVWQFIAFAIAVGVMAAPDVLGLNDSVSDAFHILGPIGAAVAGMAASTVLRGMRRLHLIPGSAIAVAGILLGDGLPALAVGLGAGVALVGLAFPGGVEGDPYAGGWSVLVRGAERGSDNGKE